MRIRAALLLLTVSVHAADVVTIQIPSTYDGAMQYAKYYDPEKTEAVPLLVTLHTWSNDYTQENVPYTASVQCAADSGWAFIFPDFRGANTKPAACGSEMAVQDILDAVAYVKSSINVDTTRIYLFGESGGGHATMLMAGRAPHLWAGVSAWVPITSLVDWYIQDDGGKYAKNIAACVGGDPTSDPVAAAEALKRSPLAYLTRGMHPPMDINAGVHDNYVPISHALNAFNAVAAAGDTMTAAQITAFAADEAVPAELAGETEIDALYGRKPVLFRRESAGKRITIFDGGHESIAAAALPWLARQRKFAAPEPFVVPDSVILRSSNREIAYDGKVFGLPLWPDGLPDNNIVHTAAEKITRRDYDLNELGLQRITEHVAEPSMLVFPVAGATAPAVLIFPGGAFKRLGIDKEGIDVAQRLNRDGIAAVVVKYRTVPEEAQSGWDYHDSGPLYDAFYADAQKAVELVRTRAAGFNIDPDNVGVLGFSAGGRLVANLMVDAASVRPDFGALVYGVLTDSLISMVSPAAPPAFIVNCRDDSYARVGDAQDFESALTAAGVAAEMHIYDTGGHGFGLGIDNGDVSAWPSLFTRWLPDGVPGPVALVLGTYTLPAAKESTAYRIELTASGGVDPYTWDVTGLPGGLSLNDNVIEGTPTDTGRFTVTITVTDAGDGAVSRAIPLAVKPLHIILPAGSERMEAEAMTLSGYAADAQTAASGGTCIKTESAGTAQYQFSGTAGTYDVNIAYFDEDDGESEYVLYLNDVQITAWTADLALGSASPDAQTLTVKTLEGIQLAAGDILKITGTKDSGEYGRVDYIETVPVNTGAVFNPVKPWTAGSGTPIFFDQYGHTVNPGAVHSGIYFRYDRTGTRLLKVMVLGHAAVN